MKLHYLGTGVSWCKSKVPDYLGITMSLDISLIETSPHEVYSANITHNLTSMADALNIYQYLWRPENCGVYFAYELIDVLNRAIVELRNNPEKYKKFDSPNGWGIYDDFLPWLEDLAQACKKHPEAKIRVSV